MAVRVTMLLLLSLCCDWGCGVEHQQAPSAEEAPEAQGAKQAREAHAQVQQRSEERAAMVRGQIEARGIEDPAVLAAMHAVPRHLFVPESERLYAYEDRPLPIAADQTISQPYIVALMSELARVKKGDRVLEVGTGSGYQAAVLDAMGAQVFSIEIIEELAAGARAALEASGHGSVVVRHGDGYAGWPEHAPFAAILITAAPPSVPEPLKQQLAIGGRLVVPVGRGVQDLIVLTRTREGFERESVAPVRFVPMTGKAQQQP
jgi:protein-L-isoaspartate(D-aspartate) O-methyltransferase